MAEEIKYGCDVCNFHGRSNRDLIRHQTTKKHLNNINANRDDVKRYKCEICNKSYLSRQSKYAHKRNSECSKNKFVVHLIEENKELQKNKTDNLIQQNTQLLEQNKQLLEMLKTSNTSKTTINYNTTTTNNITINQFLSTQCKDAMTVDGFFKLLLENIQSSNLKDLDKLGFVTSVSNLLNNALNSMDINQRPLHFTDMNRLVSYIKNPNNDWEKDHGNNALLSGIKLIETKHNGLIVEFADLHPQCQKNNGSPENVFYNNLQLSLYGPKGLDKVTRKRIIRNVAKKNMLNKSLIHGLTLIDQ